MKRIDETVLRETRYIAVGVLLCSALMQAGFLIAGQWDYTVLLGNILSGIVGILNFLFMGITVQKAIQKEQDAAKTTIKFSQLYRMLFLLMSVILGVILPCFHMWAVIIPLFFPRIAIAFRPCFNKKDN